LCRDDYTGFSAIAAANAARARASVRQLVSHAIGQFLKFLDAQRLFDW
jgi:hypothetical protein